MGGFSRFQPFVFLSAFFLTTLLDSSCVKFRSGSREENDAAGHSEASMVPCSALFSP